jgi:hypothetical protein
MFALFDMRQLPLGGSSKLVLAVQVGQPALALAGAHGADQFANGFPEAVCEGIHEQQVSALG